MLRYNTNGGNNTGMPSKPVDYYRPLTVDVSVEYELPKEVAPPKGSAPLLIIHPSAYFRSKTNQSPSKTQGHRPASTTGPAVPAPTNPTTRLGDIASTLYYLSTSGLPPPQVQTGGSPAHINATKSGVVHHRYGGTTQPENNTSRITRSRTAAKAERSQNCDDYRTRLSSLSHQSLKFNENGRLGMSGGVIKKVGQPYQQAPPPPLQIHQNQYAQNHLMDNNSYGGAVPMEASVSSACAGIFSQNQPSTTARGTVSNKRLRMMNQQQAPASNMQMSNAYPTHAQTTSNPPGMMMMEPLNLALTPTAPQPHPHPVYNNQFSTFLGYGLQPLGRGGVGVGNSPTTLSSAVAGGQSNNHSYQAHLSSIAPGVLPQSNHFLTSHAQQSNFHSRGLLGGSSGGGIKDGGGGPVPVDKGSGSDSGVCSENDSDDVSPPMAGAPHHHFSNSNSTTTAATSHVSRRSNLSSSQEFSNLGCYCCCCPSGNTSSSRKGSKGSVKGHQPNPTPTFPSGLTNYGNLFNVIQQQQQRVLGEGGAIQPHGGSPMDSSAPPQIHIHLHNQTQQQRKWVGTATTSLVSEGLGLPGSAQMPNTYGKWYQV